ncbi:MAG: hypothetical protein FWD31_13685, partial [Planctomycetaceae bacterium]|nr:hypothetical protein [Planctomycetaceae bacterium]
EKRLYRRGENTIRKGLKIIRKKARDSMKFAKRGVASSKGTPPHVHRLKKGSTAKRLRDMIHVAPETSKLSGVVGAIAQWASMIADLHEFGGKRQKTRYQFKEGGKYLTRLQKDRHYRNRLNRKLKRENRNDVLSRTEDRELMRGTRGPQGYDPKAVGHNRNSRKKMEAGLRPMSEKELEKIKRYYSFEKDYLEEKYIKRKITAKYPKRQFMKPAFKASLPEIASALRGSE